ncbi:MAG TPA: hypothetical protein VL549_14045 [Gemmatimonadales bacterium]|jgi:hypothetical protein|nr:hypothetical protein [Gemmatimonadales bacterium]
MVNTYLFYLALSIALTVWVGHTLHKNGRPFLLHAFDNNALIADSINNLLLVGFYLINFGFVTLALKTNDPVLSLQAAIELLSVKIGQVLLVLGGMHFFNMHMLHKLGRRKAPRPLSPPGLGQTVLRGAA